MAKKNKGSAIGVSFILVVFILLCLITFGTLSYLQAKVDNELSRSSAENTLAYYQADVTAQTTLASIDQTLAAAYATASDQSEYFAALQHAFAGVAGIALTETEGALLLTFETPVSEKETIVATIETTYPTTQHYYTITAWVLTTNKENTT